MIKTVILDGSEVKIEGLSGQNTIIRNLGGTSVYASTDPGIIPGSDGVIEISAGGGENLYGTNGTVYLLGSGKVQLTGTDYSTVNFKMPSSGSGGGDVLVPLERALTGVVSDDVINGFILEED